MKLLKSMRNLLCGCSCTKDACAVRNDALSSVIGESPPIRPRASVRQRHRRRVVPLSQDIFHRSHLPPIPEADKEENDKNEVPPLNKTKDWGKHLYPAVLLMRCPHLPLIPEEEKVDDFSGNGSGKEEEAENVNKDVLEGTMAGNVVGGSDFQEAMMEVLVLMAESSDSTGAMSKFYNPAPVTACGIPATIANVIWRPQLPVIPEEEEFDTVDDDASGKEEEAENVNKDVLEGTMAGNVAGVSDFEEAMNEVLALMTESSESVVAMHNVHNPSPVTSRGVPATIANVIWRPQLPVIPEEEEFDTVDDDASGKEEEAENVNKDVLEGTMAGNVAGVSDFQEAMNEVLALMTESSESVVAMHNVHNPSPVTSRGVPATIANFIWRPHLPPIPEEETV